MCGNGEKKQSAREGFSLIVVLIVALIGMALLGIAFYVHESSSGRTQTTLERMLEYNALQGGLESGKDILVTLMNNTKSAPRWFNKPGFSEGTQINDPDTLLIEGGSTTRSITVHGAGADLQIDIYDLRYDEGMVNVSAIPSNRLDLMPPSIEFEIMKTVAPLETGQIDRSPQVTNGGIYLVRATLKIGAESKRMETVVIQRNLQQ